MNKYIKTGLSVPRGWTAGVWDWFPIPPGVVVKNEWSYASAVPIRGHGVKRTKDIHLFLHFSSPFRFILLNLICMEPGIGHGLGARGIMVRFLAEARDFSPAHSVYADSALQPSSTSHGTAHWSMVLRASGKLQIASVSSAQQRGWTVLKMLRSFSAS